MRRLWLALGLLACTTARSEEPVSPDPAFACLGRLRLRSSKEIEASNWSVGAETMCRDYTVYRNWREYLGKLGVKKARIQSGWAKTEKAKGQYDWAWLDEIIPDMVAQGVEPWMCLSYGNPLYEGGGTPMAESPLPFTPEALAAWDRFVKALAERYAKQIDEWEIWNEPNHTRIKAEDYASFLIRTAEILRVVQPQARILAFGIAGVDSSYPVKVLGILKEQGKLGLVSEVTYHPYSTNPDDSYGAVGRLRKAIAALAPEIRIRQGENGAPSTKSTKALGNYPWTETMQAKWTLRRMLGDLGRDVESSIFSIMDMYYKDGINRKGLLLARDDKTVERPKPAYHALQRVTAVFDASLKRIPEFAAEATPAQPLAVFAYAAKDGGQIVTVWLSGKPPVTEARREALTLVLKQGRFEEPVFVDLLSGRVYKIPDDRWKKEAEGISFRELPVPDYPVLIAERKALVTEPLDR
jgi:hypothetical protein